jgi:hypothetical protein
VTLTLLQMPVARCWARWTCTRDATTDSTTAKRWLSSSGAGGSGVGRRSDICGVGTLSDQLATAVKSRETID